MPKISDKPLPSRRRSDFRCGLVVVLFAALMAGVVHWKTQGDYHTDSYLYLAYAQSVLQQGWQASSLRFPEASTFPMLLVGLITLLARCGMEPETAGRLLNVAGCLGLAWGVWSCCRVLYRDRLTAVCSALLVMSLPGWYRYSSGILRDPLFWCLLIWQLRLLLTWRLPGRCRWRRYGVFALLAGLGLLCRKEQLLLLPLELLLIAVEEYRSTGRGMAPAMRIGRVLAAWGSMAFIIAGMLFLFHVSTGNSLKNSVAGFTRSWAEH